SNRMRAMTYPCRLVCSLSLVLASLSAAAGQPPVVKEAKPNLKEKMPLTKLMPSKLFPNLCLLKYRISTDSPDCQAFFDQGLGFFYSYAWMEASRSFETAVLYDQDCAMAWWGLSRALDQWGRGGDATTAMKKANDLKPKASWSEQQLILA